MYIETGSQAFICGTVGENVAEYVVHTSSKTAVHGMGDCRQTVINGFTVEAWIFIVELLPCVVHLRCLCAVLAIAPPGPHHCAALGIRTDDLLGRRRRQGLARSEKTWEVAALLQCATLTQERANVPPQTPSAIRRCASSAVQPTRDGGNGQARGSTNTVHSKSLPLAVVTVSLERDAHEKRIQLSAHRPNQRRPRRGMRRGRSSATPFYRQVGQ